MSDLPEWSGCCLDNEVLRDGIDSCRATARGDVVIGVGLNVAMPGRATGAIDQPWIDLRNILGPGRVSRNRLAARVIGELVRVVAHFEREGWEDMVKEWERFDLVAGQRVGLKLPGGAVTGIGRGADESGALLLQTETGIKRFTAGEISLRFEP